MPDGETHVAATFAFVVAFLLGAVAGFTFGLGMVAVALGAMVFGEVLLSPDLDHDSGADAYRRWWAFRLIWWPYQKLVPHRGVLSHCPVIGTAARLGYLSLWAAAGWYGLYRLGWVGLPPVEWAAENWRYVLAAFAGVELSTDLHVALDKWV
jgi:uncharacterized metal-binding protein